MHLVNCEHPLVVYNRYINEYVATPCRKCNTCRNRYALSWQKRLEMEIRTNRYAVFFTLTYAPEYVPTVVWKDGKYVSEDFKRVYVVGRNEAILTKVENDAFVVDDDAYFSAFTASHDKLYYLRFRDVQNFIKRLRSRIDYLFKKEFVNEKGKIRYFICGEYGPTTEPHRPHYHGLLFFESETVARKFDWLLHSCWSIGFVNWSFARKESASYVAKYVNGSADLPSIYSHDAFRSKFLCSTRTPLGSGSFIKGNIREEFLLLSPTRFVYDVEKRNVTDVPLPRSFESRLYPKIVGYSRVSCFDRITLLRFGLKFFKKNEDLSFNSFVEYVYNSFCVENADLRLLVDILIHDHNSLFCDYDFADFCFVKDVNKLICSLDYLRRGKDGSLSSLKNFFYLCRHVDCMLTLVGLSLEDYVYYIDEYYKIKDYENLKKQLDFEGDFVIRNNVSLLINLDPVFVKRAFETDFWSGDDSLFEILSSYGIDQSELRCGCDVETEKYMSLSYERSYDYMDMVSVSRKLHNDSLKNKKRNDII